MIQCEEQHLHRLFETCFCFFLRINDLELKSPEDALDLADYMTIVSRAYGLLAKQEDESDQLPTNATLTIVCSVRPKKLLEDLQAELQFFPTSEPGIYLNKQRIEERIIVSSELDVIEKNYPLLILAKGKKLLEFFEQVVMKGLTEYVEILLEVGVSIDPETMIEGVRRMAERHHELTPGLKRALESWFEDYPQHIYEMAPIRRFVEERVRNASIRASMNAVIQAKRETLSLLLESKFGTLSKELISQLEAVNDVDELTQLYKLALDAQTLEEIGLQKSAVVAGDIDLEDCQTAVEWANQVLETPISIPVLADGQRLIDRLSPHCDPDSLEERFSDLFRGSETTRRLFLIAHKKDRDAVQALAKELSGSGALNIGALVAFRSWLDATHDIEGLFQACCTHEQGPKWEVSQIISCLSNLWILNPVEETEALMDFIRQGGIFTLPTVNFLAAFYPELNPINSKTWYRPGAPPVIEAITAVTGIERSEIEALVTTAYQQQAEQLELMKQKASEEIQRVQEEEKRESAFNLDEFKASFASKIDEFKQFLREKEIPLTVETLLPFICRLADHNDILLTEDAWAAIDNETDVETLIGIAFLFSISERTDVLVKGREEFIESGEYRKWFASK